MTVSPATTVADLVVGRASRARLFEQLGLDYCCGGKRSLEDACRAKGLDVATVAAVLDALDETGDTHQDVTQETLAGICDHVVAVHHERLRAELPRLSALLAKVERAHGAERPELASVRSTFEELRAELESHIADEEQRTFPAVRRLEAGDASANGLRDELAALEDEHEHAGELLERLSGLTGGYDVDAVRCNTHRAVVDGLAELQRDLHLHVHEENNVLFPRVTALLERRSAG